jgi:hypothetical protein
MTEWDAETLLCSMFERDGATIRRQVPLGGRRLDVAARFAAPGGEWVSVEVKLRDWKRAVSQASVNRAFFARSFIAVPAELAGPVDEAYLRARGVGLIKFDSRRWWVGVEAAVTAHSQPMVSSIDEKLA